MGLFIAGLLFSIYYIIHAIYLRICYFKHEAVCLECLPHNKYFMSSVHYEYELKQAEKMVTCEAWGRTYFYPREGKKCKILICKKDYYKVRGYMVYVVHLLVGGVLSASTIIMEILFR